MNKRTLHRRRKLFYPRYIEACEKGVHTSRFFQSEGTTLKVQSFMTKMEAYYVPSDEGGGARSDKAV